MHTIRFIPEKFDPYFSGNALTHLRIPRWLRGGVRRRWADQGGRSKQRLVTVAMSGESERRGQD